MLPKFNKIRRRIRMGDGTDHVYPNRPAALPHITSCKYALRTSTGGARHGGTASAGQPFARDICADAKPEHRLDPKELVEFDCTSLDGCARDKSNCGGIDGGGSGVGVDRVAVVRGACWIRAVDSEIVLTSYLVRIRQVSTRRAGFSRRPQICMNTPSLQQVL